MSDFGVIILAAGGSTRMGRPKQLLKIKGQTLIRKTVETALSIQANPIVAVLGNAFEAINEEIADLKISTAHNTEWQKGMAGSLRIGVQRFRRLAPETKAVLLLLCDQPLITPDYLQQLYLEWQTTKMDAVASAYKGIKGVPAIFKTSILQQFTATEGDFGARHLIKQLEQAGRLSALDFPAGAIDLDTPDEYQQFLDRE